MGTLRPGVRLHEYAADAYDSELMAVANRLRRCADDVQRRGSPTGLDVGQRYTDGARYVIDTVTSCLANLQLTRLVQLAQQADPPADTPAVLLDRAITNVVAKMAELDCKPDDDVDVATATDYAEAALRGAGVIR